VRGEDLSEFSVPSQEGKAAFIKRRANIINIKCIVTIVDSHEFLFSGYFWKAVDFQKRSDSRSTANNKKCENPKVKMVYACIRLLYLMDC